MSERGKWGANLPPAGLVLLAVALVATTAYGAVALFDYDHDMVIRLTLAQGTIYAVAVFAALRWKCGPADARRALFFVLGVAAILRLMLLFAPPHSTDIYRYVWDGRVQAAGINPYVYVPADPALARLRDDDIYPYINRADYAPTVYPPAAQWAFFLATGVAETVTAMKAAMLGFEALAIWAIAQLLVGRGQPPFLVLIYAWHPLPLWEFAGSGHMDAIAIAFLMLALWAADARRSGFAGAAFAAAVAAKYFPLVLAPAIYRRWGWKFPLAFFAALTALYLPYISSGQKVLGFLSGYASEGGLSSGDGLFLAALLKHLGAGIFALPVFLMVGALALGPLAATTFFRASRKPDLFAAFALAVTFTVLFSPHHAWYFAWLVPFLCFYPSTAVLYLTLAATWLYRAGWPPDLWGAAVLYLPFAVLALVDLINFRLALEKSDERPAVPLKTA